MRVKKTSRGFELIEFTDIYGDACSLQVSSLADRDAIWLGCNEARIHPATGEKLSPRMHLDKRLAKRLIRHLNNWLETGSFKGAK